MRELITLACDKCRRRNYASTRNTTEHPDRLELRKYCKFCRSHTPHRQTK